MKKELSQLIATAKNEIDVLLKEYGKTILLFSGGKDSLVIYDLCKNQDNITAMWVNTGSLLPHMRKFIQRYDVVEVTSDKARQNKEYGIPVSLWDGQIQTPKLQDWRVCCGSNRTQPKNDYIKKSGVKLVIHGQRELDEIPIGKKRKNSDGVLHYSPIWAWQDNDVYEYLKLNNIELPEQYDYIDSSFECWDCTAIDKDHERFNLRYNYLKKRYPNLAERLRKKLTIAASGI